MSIGSKVRKYRESKGWSQDELALRLDVAQTTVSNIESDKNIPNSILLSKIAKELEVDLYDLLEEKHIINNVNNEPGSIGNVGDNNTFTIYTLSEKLIEQYSSLIKSLQEQLRFWKNKNGNG